MNKEQVITDEMVTAFIDKHFPISYPQNWSRTEWDKFKSSHQPPQQEWEVVELMKTNGVKIMWEHHKDGWAYDNADWVDNNINYGCKIHAVRRTYDSSELQVGKEYEIKYTAVNGGSLKAGVEKILLHDNVIYVYLKEGPAIAVTHITTIKECTPEIMWVVFTQDGFDLPTWIANEWVGKRSDTNFDETVKYFTTEKEAWDYVKDHTPNKSLAMIREALKIRGFHKKATGDLMEEIEKGLSQLKSKDI